MTVGRVATILLSCMILAVTLSETYLSKVIADYVLQISAAQLDLDILLTVLITLTLLPAYLLIAITTNSVSTCTVTTLTVITLLRTANSPLAKYIAKILPVKGEVAERIGAALALLRPCGTLTWLLPATLILAVAIHIYALYIDMHGTLTRETEHRQRAKLILGEIIREGTHTLTIITTIITILILTLTYMPNITTLT